MKILLAIFPVAFLVCYSQIVVKWRANINVDESSSAAGIIGRIFVYLKDPYIVSAYFIALLSSFLWLLIIAKLPLATAFPIYQGLIFIMVSVGSYYILNEVFTFTKVIGIMLILIGIIVASKG